MSVIESEYLLAPNVLTKSASSSYRGISGAQHKGQTHFHTTNSIGDGATGTPEQMEAQYKSLGFDWLNFSEHDYGGVLTDPVPGDPALVEMTGCEQACTDVASTIAHIVVFNIHSIDSSHLCQTIINNSPYFSYFAHPADTTFGPVMASELESFTKYNAIAVNSAAASQALWDAVLTSGRAMNGIGEDDAHAVSECATRAWTILITDDLTVAGVLAALQAGHYYSTSGPLISSISETGKKLGLVMPTNCNFTFVGTNGSTLMTVLNVKSAVYPYFGDEGYVRCKVVDVATAKVAFTNPVMFV